MTAAENQTLEEAIGRALGRTVPVNGRPTLITDGGDLIPGYLEPDVLAAELDRLKSPRLSD